MKSWRDDVDKSIKNHLELQIKETISHSSAYSKAKNQANAQLWIAIANLSKQIFDLNLKMKFLEKALQEIARPKAQVKQAKQKDLKELKKSLRKL
ncbi:MAG: hypothetical protein AB1571_03235 [Nanoarchaeota archaeon]